MAKKTAAQDWSKAAIRYAVHARGLTFKGLALAHGYRSVDAVAQALHRPYPKVERIIAEALGERPEVIWPSRYPSRYGVNKQTKCSAPARRNLVNVASVA